MSDDHSHENMIPPGALKAAIALVGVSLLLVGAVRVGAVGGSPSASELRVAAQLRPVAERRLRFVDAADGHVLVSDAVNGEAVATIGSEGGGFIRGVMRGLARERRQHREGASAPFRLAAWPDGA